VGKAGFELWGWALPPVGLARKDIFIDNTLRCLPPRNGDSAYPKGAERKRAEAHCRQYDRWNKFNPDIIVETLHPAAIVREPTPLWLQIKDFEKARDFAKRGLKVLVLCGGKAVKWFLGYGDNVTKWRGHYEYNSQAARERRSERLVEYSQVSLEKEKKGAKKKNKGGKVGKDNAGTTSSGFLENFLGER
jgi:uracil-DNA glycosylase